METPKIELKEMPTKDLLERFVSEMVLGQAVTVIFNTETGRFEDVISNNPVSTT